MKPSIQLPERWVAGERLSFGESNSVEFKLAASLSGSLHTSLAKYRDTLIAFLNCGGGWLFLGVRDDGTIHGMSDVDSQTMDKFNIWVDTTYNLLVHRQDGTNVSPHETYLKVHTFPVEENNSSVQTAASATISQKRYVVAVEAVHKGEMLSLMTRGGESFYRLNASNYKMTSEPVFRKRDVQGMIHTVQNQMQGIITRQQATIKAMQEKHKEELNSLLEAERKDVVEMMNHVSNSLYIMYHAPKEEKVAKRTWVQWALWLVKKPFGSCF